MRPSKRTFSKAILAALGVSLLAVPLNAATREESTDSANSQDLLAQAEPAYKAGNYKAALPFYIKSVQSLDASSAPLPDRLRSLHYLGDCYCRLNQPNDALKIFERVETMLPADDTTAQVANLNDEAACLDLKNDFAKAEAQCRAALKIACDSTPEAAWQHARTVAHLAYINYLQGQYAEAIPGFEKAQEMLAAMKRTDRAMYVFQHKLTFGQAGSYYHLHRFAEAYDQFRRLYQLDVRLFGKTDLQTGWAMMALSDVLEKINKPTEAEDWYRKSIYVFRKYNADRLCKEYASPSQSPADLEKRINRYVFGNSAPPADMKDDEEPLFSDSSEVLNTHDLCSLYARPFTDAPGRVWLNPQVKQKGIVIAIHGLSLQHSSYDALARQFADAGYSTVAFDMRGFGAYRQALGAENLDFNGCMRDLRLVVKALKHDNPNTTMFILGESMGGAIALQFTAQNPQLADGLITSVPAGKRFKGKRTALKVAIKYIHDKNHPFDIGTDVINQATHDPKLKQEWAGDPMTRSTLSPQELIAFQLMCNRNEEFAKQIQSTPSIVFQGVSDGLVKPEATYDLFRAIACKDKSLVMIGNAEHLIFEEGCFTPAVLKGLVAWMESHSKLQNTPGLNTTDKLSIDNK